ncbi:hypothetical protein BsWGS_06228 [Bradybaena similaris]
MRKRARRGRGRGRRGAAAYVEVQAGGDLDPSVTTGPGFNEEMDAGGELVVEQISERERTPDVPVNSCSTESIVDGNNHVNTEFVVSATLPSPPSNANSNAGTTVSSSSSSSLDGDAASDAGDNEQMHTGFMQTGPSNYRIGSTIVNLSNCSEDDVTPEFRQNDICLQVECGDNKALMYMSKLYQGSKGKCIELDGKWLTPNEFQAISGRESAKDWKRSIRHHGRSLKLLLSKNVLDVHPAACRCDSCSQLQQLVSLVLVLSVKFLSSF